MNECGDTDTYVHACMRIPTDADNTPFSVSIMVRDGLLTTKGHLLLPLLTLYACRHTGKYISIDIIKINIIIIVSIIIIIAERRQSG